MGIGKLSNCSASKDSNVGGINKYIDTAYDDIQQVANNLDALLELNATFQNLNGVFLGSFTVVPTARNNGDPLENGDHYLNTNVNLLYVHLDGGWIYHAIFYTQAALNAAIGTGPFNIWIAYADDVIGTGITTNPSNKSYVGFANGKANPTVNISDASQFTWSKSIGVDGINSYIHVAYSTSSDGSTNFNHAFGTYMGTYVDTLPAHSNNPALYNWNRIQGQDGLAGLAGRAGVNGNNVSVTDLGGGRTAISDGVSTIYLSDGEIPTLTDNGDGTFTISSGFESITVTDGKTPLIGIDYYDGNNGDYISFVFAQVIKGAPAPTILAGTGTWDGTIETYPTGAAWSDNAKFTVGYTTYMSKNSYKHDTTTDTWTLRNDSWNIPTIFMDRDLAVQSQIKGLAFIRAASTPGTAPTGGSFASPTPTTAGWSDGIPTGTLPIYIASATFTSDGFTPQSTGNPVVWSVPQLLAENGLGFKLRFSANIGGPWTDVPTSDAAYMITSVRDSAGIWVDDEASVIRIKGETGTALQTQVRSFCFKRSSNSVFAETPQGGSFLNPAPVDGTVVGWSDGIPAGTDRLYVSTRIFTSDGLTPQQVTWAPSQVFTYNGTGMRSLFSIDGLTDWHTTPAVEDEYMQVQTSDDGGVTWTDLGAPIKIKGEAGPQGPPGTGSQTIYTWIKYADDAIGTNLTDDPSGKYFLGLAYNKTTATESTTASDYLWSRIGSDQGPPGPDGATTYTWVKYADNSAGGGLSDDPTGKTHIGLSFNNLSATESNLAGDYTWALFRGSDGVPGAAGAGIYKLITTGSATATANSVNSGSGTDWASGAYTEESYAGACYASFRLIRGSDRLMAGISAASGTNPSYSDIDFAFYRTATNLQVYENATARGSVGVTPSDNDIYTIVDDGSGVRYYQNGTLVYTSDIHPSGIAHRFKTSFAGISDRTTQIVFGPIGERGTDGADALGTLPNPFNPGVVGGAGDFVFTLDSVYNGTPDIGETRIQGTSFLHPDGTPRTLQPETVVYSAYGEGIAGQFFLMWTDEEQSTRFATSFVASAADNIVPVRANGSGGWEVFGNSNAIVGTGETFTPIATDCIIAAIHAEATSGGLTSIVPFVSGATGLDGVRGTKHYYTTVTTGVWTSSVADAYILSQGDIKQVWDVVTISDAPSGFSQTRYWSGTGWPLIEDVIDGNLIVLGTIRADRLISNSITAGQISADTITAIEMTADSITAREIEADSITAEHIEAGSITATEIQVDNLQALSANVGVLVGGSITGSTLKTANTGKRVLMDTSETPLSVFNDNNELIFGTLLPDGATDVELYFKGRLANDSINDSSFLTGPAVTHLRGRLGIPEPTVATGGDISFTGDKSAIAGDFQITNTNIHSGGNFMTASAQGTCNYERVTAINPGTPVGSTVNVQFYKRTSTTGVSYGSWTPEGSIKIYQSTITSQLFSTSEPGFPVANWRITETLSIDVEQDIATTAGLFYQIRCVIYRSFGQVALVTAANSSLSSFTVSEVISGSGSNASTLGNKAPSASGARYNSVPFVDSAGVMEIGRYIDFHGAHTSTDDYEWRINVNGTSDPHMEFRNDTGAIQFRMDNGGSFHANADGYFRSTSISSDPRLKREIYNIEGALSKVNELNGVTFIWKEDNKVDAGLISTDVARVLPQAVTQETRLSDPDGIAYDKVNYNAIIGLLVESIKELTAKVEKLENASTD